MIAPVLVTDAHAVVTPLFPVADTELALSEPVPLAHAWKDEPPDTATAPLTTLGALTDTTELVPAVTVPVVQAADVLDTENELPLLAVSAGSTAVDVAPVKLQLAPLLRPIVPVQDNEAPGTARVTEDASIVDGAQSVPAAKEAVERVNVTLGAVRLADESANNITPDAALVSAGACCGASQVASVSAFSDTNASATSTRHAYPVLS